jgi:3-oxoacyl-[acyl-carrier-protein] synthase II
LAGEARSFGQIIRTPSNIDRKEYFIKKALKELLTTANFIGKYGPEDISLCLGLGIDYFDLTGYVNSGKAAKGDWHDYIFRSTKAIQKITEENNISGGNYINVAACVASSQAIGLAYRMIHEENNKAVIAGGSDSMLSPLHYMGFFKLGALSQWEGEPSEACRPFDRKRGGLVLGEGSALFLMENAALADKNKIMAEITGYSSTMDAYMVTDPEPSGEVLSRAALEALREANITPDDIECVHLHGTGTYKNALAETKAMELIFGPRYSEIPVFSLKGQVGHLIGACGAVEMLAVIYSLTKQIMPPTVNFEEPDPEVPLKVIKGDPLKMKINNILKLNSSFGGENTAIIARKYEA